MVDETCIFKEEHPELWLHCMSYINFIFGRLGDRKLNLVAKFFTTLVTVMTIQILLWFYRTSKEKEQKVMRPLVIKVEYI